MSLRFTGTGAHFRCLKAFIELITEDICAYDDKLRNKKINVKDFVWRYIKTFGFRVTTHMRLCKYLHEKTLLRPFYYVERIIYRHLQVKYGIQIPYELKVGGGFRIDHFGGIVINIDAILGENVTIRHNVTIGGTEKGAPTIGSNVQIGAGALIIGNITIGDNCIIGAGSVVVKSVPDNSKAAGNPARLL